MKTNSAVSPKLALWCAVLAVTGFVPARLHADDKPAPKGPPLHIAVDTKPINRDAADRVSYAPIVKKTAASVVYVYSTKKIRGQDLAPFLDDPMLRRFFGNPGSRNGRRNRGDDSDGGSGSSGGNGSRGGNGGGSNRLPDQTQQGLGSGVVITADGYVLTNNHVVEGADEVKVAVGEYSKRFTAKVVGRDPFSDIAVLKIETTGLTPAVFGDSDQLEVGDVVLAIGNPFAVGQSVSRGIVSALSRAPAIEQGGVEDFIQTDAAINPGNSGGALLDSQGRVVGINTAILSSSGGFNGVGFAIPINLVRFVAEQIVNKGHVDRGFLGVSPQDLTEDLTAEFKAESGALINEVTADSPADKAGLKAGDVITKVNGSAIHDSRTLVATVSRLAPETKVAVEYERDGKTKTITVTLGRRPDDSLARNDATGTGKDEGVLNGVGVGEITAQLREQLDIPARIKGAIITSVDADSPSGRQGLREGDVILSLDRKDVHTADEAVKLSADIKGPKVLVNIWREGRKLFVVVDESK